MIEAVVWLFGAVVQLIVIILIVNAVLSWLIAFEIVPRGNRIVGQIYQGTSQLMAPLLNPIRRFIPAVGGMDLSPVVLILGLLFLERLLVAAVY